MYERQKLKSWRGFLVAGSLILAAGLFFALAPQTHAASVYVDATNGNDTMGTGTAASPYKTITKGLSVATDSVYVKPGTYNTALGESFPITVPASITLSSTDGPATTSVEGTTSADKNVFNINSNATISGFTIKGMGTSYFKVGIYGVQSHQVTITNNIFVGDDSGFGGILLSGGTGSIVNNIIRDTVDSGIIGLANTEVETAELIMSHNTIYSSGIGLYIGEIVAGTLSGIATNNIIVADTVGISNGYSTTEEETLTSKYNLIESPTVYDGTILDKTGDITDKDPLLTNPASGIFYLSQTAAGQTANSPAVDAGSGTAASLGYAGKHTRSDRIADTGTIDLGYHYAGASPSVILANDWPAIAHETVTVNYHLSDGNSLPSSLQAEYSLDGGVTWHTATAASGGDGLTNISSSPEAGNAHKFLWDTLKDAPLLKTGGAKFRLKADNGVYTMTATSNKFVLDNELNFGPHNALVTVPSVGGAPQVRILNSSGAAQYVAGGFMAFPQGLRVGYNVAVGDLNGDGEDEIVVAPKGGAGPQVRVFNKQGRVALTAGFFAYDQSMRCGVDVATGDLNDDGKDEIITIPGAGCPAQVRIFDYRGHSVFSRGFYAYPQGSRVGFRVAAGDVNGDGRAEIVTVPESGAKAQVRIFNSRGQAQFVPSFDAFGGLPCGGDIAVGDLNDDWKGEIVVVAGPGYPPHVRVFNYRGQGILTPGFYAYAQTMKKGVRLSVGDLNNDGRDEIITVPAAGAPAQVRVLNARGQNQITAGFYAYPQAFRIGADIAVANF